MRVAAVAAFKKRKITRFIRSHKKKKKNPTKRNEIKRKPREAVLTDQFPHFVSESVCVELKISCARSVFSTSVFFGKNPRIAASLFCI